MARAIKTVHVNAYFIREEAKQARDTSQHQHIVSMQNSIPARR